MAARVAKRGGKTRREKIGATKATKKFVFEIRECNEKISLNNFQGGFLQLWK